MADSKWKKVDATDLIMGRMCTQIAKQSLLGTNIVIVNAKKVAISGRRNNVLEKYRDLMNVRTRSNPRHGPFHSSRPDTFLRQRIRFMLPKNERGKKALRRIHVYINGVPKPKINTYGDMDELKIQNASAERLSHKYITVGDVCTHIGWSGNSRDLAEI